MPNDKQRIAMAEAVLAEMNDYDLEDKASFEEFLKKEFYFGFGSHIVPVPNDADVWSIMERAIEDVLKILKGEY